MFTSTSNPELPGALDRVTTPPSKDALFDLIETVVDTIGTTGDSRNKLGFALGPIALDHTDDEVTQLIQDGFAIAEELDLAVAFHIDDSMFWGRLDTLADSNENIEWRDWNGTPNTGRRIDWGPEPTRLAEHMCFNSPDVIAVVEERAQLIGREVESGLERLRAAGQQELYAGFMSGWETQLGRDFATDEYLGYCGLTNMGYSASEPPDDIDYERTRLVKDFIDLWARELVRGGVPSDKLYSHIVFTVQGLDDPDRVANSSYEKQVHFSTPDVAFGDFYRPGFSTYPSPGTFAEIHEQLERNGNPPWASAEGTNVVPSGVDGEGDMETYLGRMFNHGAVMVNIFSWGLGGDELRDNMFRQVTERPEAIAAYRKFLAGEALVENPPEPLSIERFRTKVESIHRDLPAWARRTGRQSTAESYIERLDEHITAGSLYAANAVADEVLALIDGTEPTASAQSTASTERSSTTPAAPVTQEEFDAKIDRLSRQLTPWVERTGRQQEAATLQQRLQREVNDGDLQGANAVAEELIALIDSDGERSISESAESNRSAPGDDVTMEEFTAKIDRLTEELPEWVERTGRQREAATLQQRLQDRVNNSDLQGANAVADELIELIESR